MKIDVNRDDLLKPLLQVGGIVEKRQTLPVLANVLFDVKTDQLVMTATDLEVELTTRVPVATAGETSFTLPARKLIDICRALPEAADIHLALEGEKAVLRSGRGRYTLGTLPAADFPGIEPATAVDNITLPEAVLKRLIDKTQFAMAQQDVRYYLNGLLLEIRAGRVRAVGTDGHRLAMCDAVLDTDTGIDIQVILPRKAVIELNRLLTYSDANLVMEMSNSHVRFVFDNSSFTTKLIDGRFPDYDRVMPSGDAQIMSAGRDLLKAALTRTAILSNEKYRGIRFKLSTNLLQLLAHNPEQDEAEEEVEVTYSGEELTIGFNVAYLLDVLGVIDTEEVQIEVIDSNSSCLVQPSGNSESRYVVMPMRL